MEKLVFSCGDVNGIGPEIVVKTLNKFAGQNKKSKFYFIIPKNVFQKVSKLVKPEFDYEFVEENQLINSQSNFSVIVLPSTKINPGHPTKESGKAAFESLRKAFNLINTGLADAVITAPVSKTAFRLAGIKFPGQTELFAHWSESKNFIMTFLSNKLKVALYSIHVPLKDVPKSIQKNKILNELRIINRTLKNDLGIKNPKIAILGLNPHAGEGGIMGKEEVEKIIPAINIIKKEIYIEGPFPADAFFANRRYKDFDLTFGLYHDQVLIPFKHINAGKGVNYTAGLPIIRTSPDHGVAYDIAWKGIANESSMLHAIKYARTIIKNRKMNVRAR